MKSTTILTVIFLLLFACKRDKQVQSTMQDPIPVQLEVAAELSYRMPVRATGFLSTAELMKLSFKTGGIIQSIPVREGVSVKKGDLLAKLDLAEIDGQVKQANIALAKAERDLERAGNLFRDSVATLQQYQDARSAAELARSQIQIAEFNLQHSIIRAPSNGKVQKVLVEENELIAPGYPAILFASTESEWVVRGSVTDKDIVKLSIGDSVQVYMDAFPGEIFSGEVSELGSFAEAVSGTYEVEVMLPMGHPQFRTGFISRMEILPSAMLKDILVPVESLQNASDRSAEIYVYNDGKALKRKLRIGPIIGKMVVVEEGLLPGEKVITVGAPYLRNGDLVEIVEDRP